MPWPNETKTEKTGFWIIVGFLLVAFLSTGAAEAQEISPHAYMPPTQAAEQVASEGLWFGIGAATVIWLLVLVAGFLRYYWYKGESIKGAFYEEFVKKQEDD